MFKRLYISPNGRCSRKFYWLFGVLPFFVIGVLAGTTTSVLRIDYNLGLAILLIITLWPMLAMQIKRWHDIGLSGWFSLLTFIPYLGWVPALVVGLIPGKNSDNRYGPRPNK